MTSAHGLRIAFLIIVLTGIMYLSCEHIFTIRHAAFFFVSSSGIDERVSPYVLLLSEQSALLSPYLETEMVGLIGSINKDG